MRLGLVTCSKYELPGPEDQLLLKPLAEHGITGIPLAWDDSGEQSLDAVLIRSAWNYWHHPVEFMNWLLEQEARGRQIINSLPILQWNLRKSYLCDLRDRGVDIIPTIVVAKGDSVDLARLIDEQGWPRIIIKPMIGGDSYHLITADADRAPRAQRILDKLAKRSGVLVQPLIPAIRDGEWSLAFFDHAFSHAVCKIPRDGDYRSQEQFGSRINKVRAANGMIIWAENVLEQAAAVIGDRLAYARVDAVLVDGQPQLMELELIDPHFFLSMQPGSAHQFAGAIANRLGNRADLSLDP